MHKPKSVNNGCIKKAAEEMEFREARWPKFQIGIENFVVLWPQKPIYFLLATFENSNPFLCQQLLLYLLLLLPIVKYQINVQITIPNFELFCNVGCPLCTAKPVIVGGWNFACGLSPWRYYLGIVSVRLLVTLKYLTYY